MDPLDPGGLPCAARVRFLETTVTLHAPSPEAVDAILSPLAPYCTRQAPARAGGERWTQLRASPRVPPAVGELFASAVGARDGESIRIFSGQRTALRFARHGILGVEIRDTGTRVVFERRRARISVFQADAERLCEDALAILRGQVLMPACRNVATVMHASAAEIDGGAVVIFGESGDGKTTLLVNLLSHFGAGFVSNDRVALSARGSGVAHGLPYPLTVRRVTALQYPRLRGLVAGDAGGTTRKLMLPTDRVGDVFGVDIVAEAPLAWLLRPVRRDDLDACATAPLDEAAADREFDRNVSRFANELSGGNWSGYVAELAGRHDEQRAAVRRLARLGRAHYVLFGRRQTPHEIARTLRGLLASGAPS